MKAMKQKKLTLFLKKKNFNYQILKKKHMPLNLFEFHGKILIAAFKMKLTHFKIGSKASFFR